MSTKRLSNLLTFLLSLSAACHFHVVVAEPTIKNKRIDSELLFAAKNGHSKAAQSLLQQGANANATNEYGNSALYLATMTGRDELVRLLIQKGARVNQKNKDDRTALDAAVTRGSIICTKILLTSGANANARDKNGFTVLMAAVSMEVMSRKLAAGGYKPDSKHRVGQADSAPDPNLTIIKLLLSKGAKVDSTSLEFANAEPSIKKLLQQRKSR